MDRYEVIFVGCGAMGAAATYHLTKQGVKVLTLERFTPGHSNGSSHGRTRIIRTALFEHESYVPLVKRAYELWNRLQKEIGKELMAITGGVVIGKRESLVVSGSLACVQAHGIQHRLLSARELRDRFEIFTPLEDDFGVYEPGAGILFPESCIEAYCGLSTRAGAEIHYNEAAVSWVAKKDGILVRSTRGEYESEKLVLTCGPWMPSFLNDLHLPLSCERQVPIWFEPVARREQFALGKMPVFIWETPNHQSFYGLPDNGDGVKVARHHGGKIVTPDQVDRRVTQDDETPVRGFLTDHLPLANGRIMSSTTCIYTNTPDENFIIDFHPTNQNVTIVSACSGHGFKFASVIGEIVSSLTLEGRTSFDIEEFALKRFPRIQRNQ